MAMFEYAKIIASQKWGVMKYFKDPGRFYVCPVENEQIRSMCDSVCETGLAHKETNLLNAKLISKFPNILKLAFEKCPDELRGILENERQYPIILEMTGELINQNLEISWKKEK